METSTFDIGLAPIGFISSCFKEKFGTPRQAGLAPLASARLQLVEPFNKREMVRGLETFSHIWIQFIFHQALRDGWKTTVRPPRLNGSERKGVLATRSPHRPNFIGLSAVRLEGIDFSDGVVLELGGVDLLDKTPVLDIKPYLRDTDCLTSASFGWLSSEFSEMEVVFEDGARQFCKDYQRATGRLLAGLIKEVLRLDPRPAVQRGKKHGFAMLLFDVNIAWQVTDGVCRVVSCSRVAPDDSF
ncbi:MAG: tRNA (N6-threonylcarbamoyladenosine(37)-N6)-methyltransferase TrmO [Desulfocapsaceae bacterium]|jgi:tRNA-Thr(GGU) m(6)t(6)A37 methyltransferase TsaA